MRVIRHVSCRICRLFRLCHAAAANSGNLICLLVVLVGYWSLETRLLCVPMADGATISALAVVLDRVLAEGGSVGSWAVVVRAARQRRCAFT